MAQNEKNQAYWDERQKKLWESMEKDEKKLSESLNKYYTKEAARLDKEIAAYYSQYGVDNVIQYRTLLQKLSDEDRALLYEQMDKFAEKYPQYADLMPVRESIYNLNRLEGLQQSIYVQQMEIGAFTNEQLEAHLLKYAERGYTGVGGFNSISPALARQLVDTAWLGGENFSQRIWGNNTKLANALYTDFRNGIIRGDSYQKMAKALRDRFTAVSRNDAMRLIYTEGTFVMNHASMEAFREMGYTHYRYSAVMDDKTSPICRELNGQVFPIAEMQSGENFPPMHPWCRSSYEIITDEAEMEEAFEQNEDYSDIKTYELNPWEIEPVNAVTDDEKLQYLTEQFEQNGYDGRPILAIEVGDDAYQAITGSHRIYAARDAGIEVPTHLVEFDKDDAEDFYDLLNAMDDDERENIILELYEQGKIDKDSVRLIEWETEYNLD
jgi:SPP1 gp7 family putative phage head morphogenesis protein